MDFFSDFCNICYKTSEENLKNIYEENMKHVKDTLISFVGQDIINNDAIYLCPLCCEMLTRCHKFREMCLSNLIQLRQTVFDMKSKLELEDDTSAVKNTLQIFVHDVLRRNSLENSNSPLSIPPECHQIVKSCEDLDKSDSICNRQVIYFKSEMTECDLDGDCNDLSQVAVTNEEFAKDFDVSDVDNNKNDTLQKDVKVKNEIERIVSDFELKMFENEYSGRVRDEVEVSAVNNNLGIYDTKEEIRPKQENSTSEDLQLETNENESGGALNVSFKIANACTIMKTEEPLERGTTYKRDVKMAMKLRSRCYNSVDTTNGVGDIENDTPAGKEDNKKTCNGRKVDVQRNGPRMCQHCHKQFATPSKLITHMRTHTGNNPYKCTICDKAFTQTGDLHRHARTHTNERPYKCNDCDKSFTQNFNLITHQRIHTNTRPYKCTRCSKTFIQNSSLTTHMRVHTGQRPYKCSVCDKAFTTSGDLTVHMRVHTGQRPNKCSVCDKAFTLSCNLTTHMRVHTGQRPYKCSVCDKAFTHSGSLAIHMCEHTGQRPYKCSVCDKAFTHSCNLTTHMRVHTGQRPYKCSVCDKAFTQSCNLTKHKRTHGNTITKPTR